MNRYLVNFYKFWYKFIIGDDWVIAATVMWGLLTVYSFSAASAYEWYLLPLVVSVLLVWLLKRTLRQYEPPKEKTSSVWYGAKPVYLLWCLMTLVLIVPYNFLYLKGSTTYAAPQDTR